MKILKNIFYAVTSIVAFSGALLLAGPRMGGGGSGGWGMGDSYMQMYNPATVELLKGEITDIDKITPMHGMSHGIHLMVKTDKETISVHLGPEWYLDKQDVSLKVGDTIEVSGSRITFEDRPAIIAREVKKGDQVLTLRDDKGYPVWSGWRRR